MAMKYRNVVWDWNGTLLNDLETGVRTLNDMLGRRGMPALSVEEYKERFGFPVIDFYRSVGFDMEREGMHDLSVDFVETYDRFAGLLGLNAGVPEVLAGFGSAGARQYVLSALREDLLQEMLAGFGIASHFSGVCGSEDIYASGKVERGRRMLAAFGIEPADTLMVGDTVHDAEVAGALGFHCILFAGGHNSEERLAGSAPVVHRLEELFSL